MSELIDRTDPKEFEAKFNAAMAPLAEAKTPDEFIQRFNYQPSAAERLEKARQKYAEHDELWEAREFEPPATFEEQKLRRERKLEEEKTLYRKYGERPIPKTIAEMAEEDGAKIVGRPGDLARLMVESAVENAQWTVEQLEEAGYASMEDMRARNLMPVPTLIKNEEGIPAYVADAEGRIVPEYIVIGNRPAYNPEFTKIHERAQRLTKLHQQRR